MLYLIATPIGNLKDISLRALEILNRVDFIACEDTRKTRILLNHYKIKKLLIPFHEYNEDKAGHQILSIIKEGKAVALVTDGGTPGISDPGYSIVQKAIAAKAPITIIPGPTASVNALVLSGLPAHSFIFRGYPPHKSKQRLKFLTENKDAAYTLIYYESPYRIKKFLKDALKVFGDRDAVIVNDLTKMFETVLRGKLSELTQILDKTVIKGEYTIVIRGAK